MGICFSTSKVSGSNSNSTNAGGTTSTIIHNIKEGTKLNSKKSVFNKQQKSNNQRQRASNESHKNQQKNSQKQRPRDNQNSRRKAGPIPCGKRTDFGYEKDFSLQYSLGKLLGHGQFGYTYVGVNKANGDRVAVKRLEKNKMVLPIAVEDVKREVKILKQLTGHENVVQFYNAFEDDSYVYIVMELCEGGELLDRILAKKDSRYTEKDAAVVVRQMLKVAAECHLHGLVHRDMKPEVLRNKPDFRRKPWPTISNAAKDFVKKLLVKDPRARYTAAQALSHPWVREGGEALEIPIDISVLGNMRQFVKYSRLKQFALRALASTLNEEELADLKDQFDAIDVDKNGSISLEEMRQALAKDLPWKLKESRVLEILQAIDSNTDGLVDFSEFVAATIHVHQLEEHDSEKWQQRSKAAFEKFDLDKDGYITPDELRMHTGLRGSINPLLEEADIDKDGKISISEFRRLLRTASIGSGQVLSPRKN
ncbi:Calcium-dependent protein kinase 28 [Senna tora]|uniref:non-specific serine/threonine protein kinase n=1 Tax=Senna tora TaxID=362788 RepID=A0A834SXD7_9FABA|nr:Calcium-dependent protein kinase 28 [Senna tora]